MQLPTPDSNSLPPPLASSVLERGPACPPGEPAAPPLKKKGKKPPVTYDEAPPEADEDEESPEYEAAPEGDTADTKTHNVFDDPEVRTRVAKKGKKRRPPVVEAEIHSAKAHRCVDQVTAKGGVDEPWAICTASIGKAGVYAKGHGGRAAPKRAVREADAQMDAYVDALVRQVRRAR
jgi:hypothetical protein